MADVIVIGLLALASASVLIGYTGLNIVVALLLAVIVVLIFLPRLQPLLKRLNVRLPGASVHAFFENFLAHASLRIKGGSFIAALLVTAAAWLLDFLTIALFFHAAGSISLGLSGALLVFVATTIGGAIPALPGGLGTYEAAAVFSLKSFGYSFEEALALGFALHATLFCLPLISSLVIVTTEKIGIGALIRNITRAARIGREQ
jgi:glycosyltransferase 2 family protein